MPRERWPGARLPQPSACGAPCCRGICVGTHRRRPRSGTIGCSSLKRPSEAGDLFQSRRKLEAQSHVGPGPSASSRRSAVQESSTSPITKVERRKRMSAIAIAPEVTGYVPIALEPLLKIEDAARLVGRTHWTLRHDVKAGRLKCVRIGRRIMIEPSEIRRLIEEGRR
jgi:hypothetical protein